MLSIPLDTIGWIIVKAREFDVKEGDSYDGQGGEDEGDVLQDRASDPTEAELTSWIDDLTDTQSAELVALMWLGRDDGDASEFPALVEQARRSRRIRTSRYLLGEPLLADHIEAGLETLGYDVAEIENRV